MEITMKLSRLKSASSIDDYWRPLEVYEKFCNIYRKTPVLESLFGKVAGLQVY